ncbi:28S ribosomal protein S35, mitochondrial [Operophtera brumata]|uniref:28S ribosomal protein S35, mitochondrial n=1 Tax=Operophtera brumata TaxID=104452 RepID=A0A0L7L2T0_OPEBR|nr:28S ribosomal protein S35, mitochondrial [Operophtera brumata]
MSLFIKHCRPRGFASAYNVKLWRLNSTTADAALKLGDEEEEFRVLDIKKTRTRQQRRVARRADVQPDRADRMSTDQTFHPSSVPLPLRQGYVPRGQAPPSKKANTELMKIPNFLHLTPPVVKSQCEALKQFCTEWPKLLNSEEAIEKNYPVEIISSDYCHGSPSIRNPLARIVTLRIKLASLNLDKHSRDKFLRLIGDRYDTATDVVTITADRCPVRAQNQDYVNYLLTACYHEAWNVEEWEKDKTEDDMEYYDWDNNKSKKSLVNWYLKCKNENKALTDEEFKKFDVKDIPNAELYRVAVSSVFNDGESETTLGEYGVAFIDVKEIPNADQYRVAVSSVFNDAESETTLGEYGVAVRKLLGQLEKVVG